MGGWFFTFSSDGEAIFSSELALGSEDNHQVQIKG